MSSNTPYFSVVIPLYNKRDYIVRSLISVLSQSFSDFEVIVIDDGSKDDSFAQASTITDPRLRFLRQANEGVSSARNHGIREARGLWIAFLDADDEWLPDYLQAVRDCVTTFPLVGAVYTLTYTLSMGKRVAQLSNNCETAFIVEDYFCFIANNPDQLAVCSATSVKRSVFKVSGLFPVGVKIGEDKDTWHRVVWSTGVAHIPKALAIYNLDASDSGWQTGSDWDIRLSTYTDWSSNRRIPTRLIKSSAVEHQKYIIYESFKCSVAGNKYRALLILFKNINFLHAPAKPLFRATIYVLVPNQIIRLITRSRIWNYQRFFKLIRN